MALFLAFLCPRRLRAPLLRRHCLSPRYPSLCTSLKRRSHAWGKSKFLSKLLDWRTRIVDSATILLCV
jgi:hypothetical protein